MELKHAESKIELTNFDLHLFNEGSHHHLYQKLGAHLIKQDAQTSTKFSVWAPNATYVSVIGDFNHWNRKQNPMTSLGNSGIWSLFIPEVGEGTCYKYYIESNSGHRVEKADPFAFGSEEPPRTASKVVSLDYHWSDQNWMKSRQQKNSHGSPWSIYELHLGSWKRNSDGSYLSYRQLAKDLPPYVKKMGFTHVELMPIMEHPFYGSWGYQITSYFAPTARFGNAKDFKYLIDSLHQAGIGVILDWVPSHFPTDEHGLGFFDGTHLFEHSDPRKGYHPDWKSFIFNYGRYEVQSFLISNALYWLDEYHIDGLRVDAVASMLYLDYSRSEGEWIPNVFGGRENLEALEFLKKLNIAVYENFPDTQTIAEESTAWPMVSKPTYIGGLGFGMKWDMGWMHDTLKYFSRDPIFRKYHHNELTFRAIYAFHENFILSLSHDEVVYGKRSLLEKMPGDDWQKFANLRLLFAYMFALPGKKLLFMGSEFGQRREWNHEGELDWGCLQDPLSTKLTNCLTDLNKLYQYEKSLFDNEFSHETFEWLDASDESKSIYSWFRWSKERDELLLFVGNFTPTVHYDYTLGVPCMGVWHEVFNSDASEYGGSGVGNMGAIHSRSTPSHAHSCSLSLTLPPLGALILKAPLHQSQRKHYER